MKKTVLLLLLLAAVACDPPSNEVRDISQEQFLATLPGSVLLLDVRTSDEYSAGHVPGAMNISHDELATRIAELDANKETAVIVYCERGGRAGKAADILLEAGFTNVQHLAGDMKAWRENGRPTE